MENKKITNRNFLFITGNLTRDSEIKDFQSGAILTTFTIAVNHSKDNVSFFDVNYWGNIELSKGEFIKIIGKIKQETWKNKEGQTRSKVSITADDIIQKNGNRKNNQNYQNDVSYLPQDVKNLLFKNGFDTVEKAHRYCSSLDYNIEAIRNQLNPPEKDPF
jgi:single-strand DNA-binding protein